MYALLFSKRLQVKSECRSEKLPEQQCSFLEILSSASWSALDTGRARRRTASSSWKIAVFAPIPSASDSIATAKTLYSSERCERRRQGPAKRSRAERRCSSCEWEARAKPHRKAEVGGFLLVITSLCPLCKLGRFENEHCLAKLNVCSCLVLSSRSGVSR